jgi:hypothetical protein
MSKFHVIPFVTTGMTRLSILCTIVFMFFIIVMNSKHCLNRWTLTVPKFWFVGTRYIVMKFQERLTTEIALRNQTKVPCHLAQHAKFTTSALAHLLPSYGKLLSLRYTRSMYLDYGFQNNTHGRRLSVYHFLFYPENDPDSHRKWDGVRVW